MSKAEKGKEAIWAGLVTEHSRDQLSSPHLRQTTGTSWAGAPLALPAAAQSSGRGWEEGTQNSKGKGREGMVLPGRRESRPDWHTPEL